MIKTFQDFVNESVGSIISSNHNGTVYKTSGSGFSPKIVFNKLHDWIKSHHLESELDVARTGSYYLKFSYQGVDYSIRIRNHTKRDGAATNHKPEVDTYDAWVDPRNKDLGKEPYSHCEFEVLDTDSKNALYQHLGIR